MGEYAAIEKEAKLFTELCVHNDAIDPNLFDEFGVKRGLRDKDGNGVLAGITNISRIDAFEMRDGVKTPCDGKLWYRGYNVYDLIRGLRGKRYGFEEVAYLLLLGDLPNEQQLHEFTDCLTKCRALPSNFVRDVIMKAPSKDLMNSLTRSVLTLASYDDSVGDNSLQTQMEQCIKLISVFPMLAVYGYHAYNYYLNDGSMYIHRPRPELSAAENLLSRLRGQQEQLAERLSRQLAEALPGCRMENAAACIAAERAKAEQALAALFHDISTPSFAHTVDFLHGDYLRQEYTEGRTAAMITQSAEITALLGKYGVAPNAVTDYHLYPIADNDSPRLSADRLEYTIGNLAGYSLCSPAALQEYYDALYVAAAPDGVPELAFQSADIAAAFARDALKMSRIYVSDEDRCAMQRLAELLRHAVEKSVINLDDLCGTEDEVIARITADDGLHAEWAAYRALHRMLRPDEAVPDAAWRVIPAKKRCIDPLVAGKGRLSEIDADFAAELSSFIGQPLDAPVGAI